VDERVVVIVEPASPLEATLAATRRVVSPAAHIHVVLLGDDCRTPRDIEEALAARFESLGVASFETLCDAAQGVAVARRQQATLVVVGPWPTRSEWARALALFELATRNGFDVLSVGARCPVDAARPGHVGLSMPIDSVALGPLTAAVRALPMVLHVTAFVRGSTGEDLAQLEPVLGSLLPEVTLNLVPVQPRLFEAVPEAESEAEVRSLDLLVLASSDMSLARQVTTGLVAAHALGDASVPLLILHRVDGPTFLERLVLSDTLAVPGRCPVSVERTSALGRMTLAPDETFALVGAEPGAALRHEDGVVAIPVQRLSPDSTFALGSGDQVATARVLPDRPLVLLDAAFPLEHLGDVEAFVHDHQCVIVRLRASQTLEDLRTRFAAAAPWGGQLGLIDASAWLDDAGGLDVPEAVDGLRLLRLATRLVALGAPVAALVTSDTHALATIGRPEATSSSATDCSAIRSPAPSCSGGSDAFVTWTAQSLGSRDRTAPMGRLPPAVGDADSRWRWLTGAPLVAGHQVTLELDNGVARARMLTEIEAATQRVHWQSYIVEDDDTAGQIAQALTHAAGRGVAVRVLVDAVYSHHDAFGAKNPLLERLAAVPGIEVHGARRVEGLPSLVDLKQRNHRKFVILDGRLATVSGRNLGAAYYQGFDEVQLSSETTSREVPWLDSGLWIQGPLVEAVERTFLADWLAAGGSPFEVAGVAVQGKQDCRLVTHEGFTDARTFEAQLEIVASATERLVLVNTFPLALELQRSLLRAVGRGVRVQFLFGHVRPRWGEDRPFAGGTLGQLADELVRSRLDPLLRAGAEGWEFALPHPELGRVFPHVHAKLYIRDADLVASGSANLDVTSAYWESEALVLVHDAGLARRTLAQIDGMLAHSRRVDVHGPAWADAESRREWLSRHWPNLIG
jgi:phosphatidylserine/phosphatidylglycerophosphate/cardiolipin synthase-like enzyme